MRILVVCQYFYPEEFKVNALVEGLVNRGHKVSVLTGKPNYPKGEYYPGYRFWGVDNEDYQGADIIRIPIIRRGKSGAIRLILNYLSFVVFGDWYVLTHKCDFDSILVYQLSPITMALPAIRAKKKCHSSLSLYVQDLWPESVSATSTIKGKWIMNYLNRLVRRVYSFSDLIFVQSKVFEESICSKGDFKDKIVYAPNWAEDIFVNRRIIDREKYRDLIPNGFVVMFAGNIGEAQDFNSIINAASITKNNKSIKWVIVGDGRAKNKAESRVKLEKMEDTVFFLGRYPLEEMPHFFCHADAMLVSLKRSYIFSLTIPSKIQAYLASGKPILTMIDGEGTRVIKESMAGLAADAEDYVSLAQNVIQMSNMEYEERRKMGENGFVFYMNSFSKDRIIDVIEKKIKEL